LGSSSKLNPIFYLRYTRFASNKHCSCSNQSGNFGLINYPNKIDRDYLYYWFEYIRASVVNFSSQTTQSNLNATTVKTFLVDHPTDLSEQTKIAEVLSTVDLAIEQTETLIAKQQRIKTGLMQDLLTRGIDEHGNLRSEQTHEFKDSPLGRIPVEWEVGGFDNYVINDAGIKPGPFGSSLTKDMYVQEGCRVYGQEQVIGGTLDIGDYFIPKRKFTEMAGFAVRVGDVLISLVGTIGHVLIVPNDHHPGLINPRLLRFRPDTRHCLPEFLRVLLLSQPIRLQLDTFATGGTMPVLSAGIIRKLCVVVIKADEQARIIQTISKSEECIFSASESLNKLRSLKTGLMQDLLTGKKRVTALLEASL
jgi:type I restriction enzyme S subunit